MLLGATALGYSAAAQADPTGGVIVGGAGTISQSGTVTDINQASSRLDINWQTFSINLGETVNFHQPSASAIAINRVLGGVPSQLAGALNANGQVYILNGAGIIFHQSAQINVGALLATTATDYVANGDGSFDFSGSGFGEDINQGTINISDGGFAVLAAPYVENSGLIRANLGSITLASTNAFTLDMRGDGLITFQVTSELIDAIAADGDRLGIDNSGELRAHSGIITIAGNLASEIVAGVINLDGIIDADAFGAGHDGGTVLISAVDDLNLTGSIHADGGIDGAGGDIITNAGGLNDFTAEASVSVRGGSEAGDGGFIELSGHSLRLRGAIDAGADNGDAGLLLIDPAVLTISAGSGSATSVTIFEQTVETLSQDGTDAIYSASSAIVIGNLGDNLLAGGSGDIALRVTGLNGSINFQDPNDSVVTTTGDIVLRGTGNLAVTGGKLRTSGGAITVTAGGDLTHSGDMTVIANGSSLASSANALVTVAAGGDIVLTGDIIATASVDAHSGTAVAAAEVSISAGTGGAGSATIEGDITVDATATLDDSLGAATNARANASLNVTAAGNIAVTGAVSVTADATNNALIGGDAIATVAVTFDTGNGGAADLSITGNLLASANAAAPNGAALASFQNAATLLAGGDIAISGAIDLAGRAVNNGASNSGAGGAAALTIDGDGAVNITGDIDVTAAAARTGGGTDSESAVLASAQILADDNVDILGNITIDADNDAAAAAGSSHDIDAPADANLLITAGRSGAGDLTLTGTTLVTAGAALNGGSANASATAVASLFAAGHIDILGAVTVTGNAVQTIAGDTESANANATLRIGAGTVGNGNLTMTGAVTVDADATMAGGRPSADAIAHAALDVDAANNISVVGAVSVTATAIDRALRFGIASASASADIQAGDDIVMSGGVTVAAVADDDNDFLGLGAQASAFLTMGSSASVIGGAIDVDGLVTVSADADNREAVGLAAALASANINANGDVDFTGGIQVTGDAGATVDGSVGIDVIGSGKLFINAGRDGTGDLTISGDTLVAGSGAMNGGTDSASGLASAQLLAGHNVSVVGDIAVTAIAFMEDVVANSEASATANLTLSAGAFSGASGNVGVTGVMTVTADARHLGGTDSAFANAKADINADDDIIIDGGLVVSGTAIVTAGANRSSGSNSAWANATADLDAGGNIDIDGNVTVAALATLEGGDFANSARAKASLDMDAGSIDIFGDLAVTADADLLQTGSSGVFALATAHLDAPGDITIDGDITVAGDGLSTALGSSRIASVDGRLFIKAGGDLTLSGATLVTAAVTVHDGTATAAVRDSSSYATALATADLRAANNVTITGSVAVQADAVMSGPSNASGTAKAVLAISAGTGGGAGNIAITGNVSADAVSIYSGGDSGARAVAVADLSALDNIDIDGRFSVTANAIGSGARFASADATALMAAGGNVTVTGSVAVDATATLDGTHFANAAIAQAALVMGSSTTAIGGNIAINGTIAVTADADLGDKGSSDALASAIAALFADDDISVSGGGITVSADALSTAVGANQDAVAKSLLFVNAGVDTSGSLSLSGASLVTANADLIDGTGDATASATASLYAANNVAITGSFGVTVDALAAVATKADTVANATLTGSAGTAAAFGSLITTNASIRVDANATYQDGTSSAVAIAVAELNALDDVILDGSLVVNAGATVASTAISAKASALALAGLTAGNNVSVTGSVAVTADADNDGANTSGATAGAFLIINADSGDSGGSAIVNGNVLVSASGVVSTASAAVAGGGGVIVDGTITVNETVTGGASPGGLLSFFALKGGVEVIGRAVTTGTVKFDVTETIGSSGNPLDIDAAALEAHVNSGSGGIFIDNVSADLTLVNVDTVAGDIVITADGNLAVSDVVAGSVGANNVTLSAGGAITDADGDTVDDVIAALVTLTAGTGIGSAASNGAIDINASSLEAHVTGVGDLDVQGRSGLAYTDIDTRDGDIALTAASGNLVVGDITASQNKSGAIALAAALGSVLDDGSAATVVAGGSLDILARGSVVISGDGVTDLTSLTLEINPTTGVNSYTITGFNGLTVDMSDGVSSVTVTDITGPAGMALELVTASGDVNASNIDTLDAPLTLTADNGSIVVGAIDAGSGAIAVTASGSITDAGPTITTSGAIALTAGGDIGSTSDPVNIAGASDVTLNAGGDLFVAHDSATAVTALDLTLDPNSGPNSYGLTGFANQTFVLSDDGANLVIGMVASGSGFDLTVTNPGGGIGGEVDATNGTLSLAATGDIGANGAAFRLAGVTDLTVDGDGSVFIDHDNATDLTAVDLSLVQDASNSFALSDFANLTTFNVSGGGGGALQVTEVIGSAGLSIDLTHKTGGFIVTSFKTSGGGNLTLAADQFMSLADGAIDAGLGHGDHQRQRLVHRRRRGQHHGRQSGGHRRFHRRHLNRRRQPGLSRHRHRQRVLQRHRRSHRDQYRIRRRRCQRIGDQRPDLRADRSGRAGQDDHPQDHGHHRRHPDRATAPWRYRPRAPSPSTRRAHWR